MKAQKLCLYLHGYSGRKWQHHSAGSGEDAAVASSKKILIFEGGAHDDENLEGLEIILNLDLELHRMGFFDIFQH